MTQHCGAASIRPVGLAFQVLTPINSCDLTTIRDYDVQNVPRAPAWISRAVARIRMLLTFTSVNQPDYVLDAGFISV